MSLLKSDMKNGIETALRCAHCVVVIMIAFINYLLLISLIVSTWVFVLCAFVVVVVSEFHHCGASTNCFREFAHHLRAIMKLLATPDCSARGGECG